jgi:hypothetical protein
MAFGDKKKVIERLALGHAVIVQQIEEKTGTELPFMEDIYEMSRQVGLATLKQGGSVEQAASIGQAMWLNGYGTRLDVSWLKEWGNSMLQEHEEMFRRVAPTLTQ